LNFFQTHSKKWPHIFLILIIASLLIGSEGCPIFKSGNFPDIDGWWEITLHSENSTCPSEVMGVSIPAEFTFKIEVSLNKAAELLDGNLYENGLFIASFQGDIESNGDFKVEVNASYDTNELYMLLEGTFSDTSTSGDFFQAWTVPSQNLQCQIEGDFSGRKL
jgi:hypothetical protein